MTDRETPDANPISTPSLTSACTMSGPGSLSAPTERSTPLRARTPNTLSVKALSFAA